MLNMAYEKDMRIMDMISEYNSKAPKLQSKISMKKIGNKQYIERQSVKKLVTKLKTLHLQRHKKSLKVYKTAGYGHNDGTGDEGWKDCYELSGESNGLLEAAWLLEKLIK